MPKRTHPEPETPDPSEPPEILQFKVWLLGISPMIWRRVQVPACMTLRELHGVVQVVMGWEGIHLFQFTLRAKRFGSLELAARSPDIPLSELRLRPGTRFCYEYDLSVPWEHEVRLESRYVAARQRTYPLCLDGQTEGPLQVRIMLQIVGSDGIPSAPEEIAVLTKTTERAEDLGLSLAESKALLAAAQQRIVGAQVDSWLEKHRHCEITGRGLRSKGSYPIIFRTLFGDVQLKSPRFYVSKERQTNGPTTISPLTQLLPDHVAPERLYLETRWASLVPYAAAAELLADVLPVESGVNATTVRQHVLRTAERMENDLVEQRISFMEGSFPRDWEDLPIPEGRMVIGLDGGYIRDWRDRKKNFELIVGRSMPDDGEARYIGFVHSYDRKPQRRIIDHLRRQGFQANQDLTFITDGGEEVRSLAERISPCSEHVLDWFHITMRITVLRQFAQGLVHHEPAAGMAALDGLRRIKWFLWHGNTYQARETIDELVLDLEALDNRYPNLCKFRTAMREFQVYITSNEASLINYGERYRSGERISSAFVEATVNAVISKRFSKRQQMQWSRRGAYLLLQTRTKTLDGSLRAAFEHWYPGMNDCDRDHRPAAA